MSDPRYQLRQICPICGRPRGIGFEGDDVCVSTGSKSCYRTAYQKLRDGVRDLQVKISIADGSLRELLGIVDSSRRVPPPFGGRVPRRGLTEKSRKARARKRKCFHRRGQRPAAQIRMSMCQGCPAADECGN